MSHLHLDLPSGLPFTFFNQNFCIHFSSLPLPASCPTHLILLDLIILRTTFKESQDSKRVVALVDVMFLTAGGKDLHFEKKRMDQCNIVICTPGRLLQHMDENPLFDCGNMQVRRIIYFIGYYFHCIILFIMSNQLHFSVIFSHLHSIHYLVKLLKVSHKTIDIL